jgi:hypothetical protein
MNISEQEKNRILGLHLNEQRTAQSSVDSLGNESFRWCEGEGMEKECWTVQKFAASDNPEYWWRKEGEKVFVCKDCDDTSKTDLDKYELYMGSSPFENLNEDIGGMTVDPRIMSREYGERELTPTQQRLHDEVMSKIGQSFASWMSPKNPPFSQEYAKGPYWDELTRGIRNIVIDNVE